MCYQLMWMLSWLFLCLVGLVGLVQCGWYSIFFIAADIWGLTEVIVCNSTKFPCLYVYLRMLVYLCMCLCFYVFVCIWLMRSEQLYGRPPWLAVDISEFDMLVVYNCSMLPYLCVCFCVCLFVCLCLCIFVYLCVFGWCDKSSMGGCPRLAVDL